MNTIYLVEFEIDIDADDYDDYAMVALSQAAAFNSAYSRSRNDDTSRYLFTFPRHLLVIPAYAMAMYPCRVVSQHRFPDVDSARLFMQSVARHFDKVAAALPIEFVHSAWGDFADDFVIDNTNARGVALGDRVHEYHDGAASPLTFSWTWRSNSDAVVSNGMERLCPLIGSATTAMLRIASDALLNAMRILWAGMLHCENILRDTLRRRCGLGISEASGWILINQQITNNW